MRKFGFTNIQEVKNQTLEEIKQVKARNSCCYSFQVLLSSRFNNRNIKICKTIIFPVVLCDCEMRSLTLRKEHRLKVFKNKILRRILNPRGKRMGNGESCITINILRIIKSWRLRQENRTVRMEDSRNTFKINMVQDRDRRIMLRLIGFERIIQIQVI